MGVAVLNFEFQSASGQESAGLATAAFVRLPKDSRLRHVTASGIETGSASHSGLQGSHVHMPLVLEILHDPIATMNV